MSNVRCRPIAEFVPHRCTYLLWPTRPDNWRLSGRPAQKDLTELADTISKYEPVFLGTNQPINQKFRDGITVFHAQYDDIWVRDTGPTFASDEFGIFAANWKFNSWGGLFETYDDDNAIAELIASKEKIPMRNVDMVFEGGAYVTDGRRTLITTADCVLDPSRNPILDRNSAERILLDNLGGDSVLWLEHGFLHDETGGHIDNICFFGKENVLFVASDAERSNPNYARAKAALDAIHTHYDAQLDKLQVIELPLPQPLEITAQESRDFTGGDGTIVREPGTPMCASYSNSYAVNGAIIMPKFGISLDDDAASIVQDALPGMTIEQVPSREFVLGGGAVHCITREIPKLTVERN